MKPISDILKHVNVKEAFTYRKPFVNPESMKKTAEIINLLFIRLQGIFGGFKQNWSTETEIESAKREWLTGFMEAKFDNTEEIKNGLAKCRASGDVFPPSVGKFIQMCREGDNFPSVEEAWREVVGQLSSTQKFFSHPVIEDTYVRTGSWTIKNSSERDAKALFLRNYQDSKKSYIAKEPLRALPDNSAANEQLEENLESKPRGHLSEVYKNEMAKIKVILEIAS